MATLTNPINTQNIVDRFADYVTLIADSGISWGTNAVPFGEFSTSYFGGSTSGRPIGITGGNIASAGSPIAASGIYNILVTETTNYTSIRYLRALLYVGGGGGNTGSRPSPGYVYDGTAVAYMNTDYLQSIGSPDNAGISTGNAISSSGLETFFGNLMTSYNGARNNTTTVTISVCHASCHSSCHSSRGRR
jgi:hypothetical protein